MALIKCPYCSSPISDRAVVCPKCGNSLVELKVCPECGSKVVPGTRACPECGFPFEDAEPDEISPERPVADENEILPGREIRDEEEISPDKPIADEDEILPGVLNSGARGSMPENNTAVSGTGNVIGSSRHREPEYEETSTGHSKPKNPGDTVRPGSVREHPIKKDTSGKNTSGKNASAKNTSDRKTTDKSAAVKNKSGKDNGTKMVDAKKILIIAIAVLAAVIIILGSVLLSRAIFGTKSGVSQKAQNTESPEPAEEPEKEDIEEPEEEEETENDEATDPENGEDEEAEQVSENETVSEPDAKEPEKEPSSKDDASRVVYPKPKPGDSSKPVKVEPAEEYEYTPVNADQKLWNDYLGAKDLYQTTVSDKLKAAEYKDFQLRQISLVDLDCDGSLEMITHWKEGKSDYLDVYGYKKKGTSAQKADQIFSCAADRIDVRLYSDDRLRTCFCMIKNRNGFVYVIDGDESRIYYRKRDDGSYTVNADFVSEVPEVYERAINTPSDWSPVGVHMLELSEKEFKEVNDALIGNSASVSCSFTSPYDTISANQVKKEPMKFVKTWDKTWDSALYQYERTL